ncbi:MAG: flavodoxin family protein [Spirochaetales bacterium]|nr:flavodoxin family protein [Spirochaetales bacterium]
MKVCGISGTPRINGNSTILLDHALSPFKKEGWEVVQIKLSEKKILPCNGCDKCRNNGTCVIDDDMAQVIDKFRECDALIVSTPVYYRTPTAQLMSLFQRYYSVREEKPLSLKPGGAIAVGRGTGGGQAITINIIYTWMLSCGMVCVPGELNGVTARADAPGDILHQPDRLLQAEALGQNVLRIAASLSR